MERSEANKSNDKSMLSFRCKVQLLACPKSLLRKKIKRTILFFIVQRLFKDYFAKISKSAISYSYLFWWNISD